MALKILLCLFWILESVNCMAAPGRFPTVLVTGSTDGIGVTTAKHLAAKGYNVLIHGRDKTRIAKAESIVRDFAKKRSSLDGNEIFTLPPSDISTVSGCTRLAQDTKHLCEENGLTLSRVIIVIVEGTKEYSLTDEWIVTRRTLA